MQKAVPQKDPENIRQLKLRYGIVGTSPALNEALERALRVAPIDLTVLVTGESGTGKEFFPKIIHNNSPRKHAPYIAVNCGAIPEGTIDSELFGHEKGSFTGAVASRKGYFEEADGGTIFLDEVAELPLVTQARLLRVLESGEFIKVGSSTVQRTNVRIVAATNVDLLQAVAKGKFREDLYYRLSTVGIYIPPLRDRGGDIMLLARKFAADFSDKYRTEGISFDDEARSRFNTYNWPGNVRQLKNIVEQMSLFEAGKTITGTIAERYLPNTPAMVPALNDIRTHAYEREREMLFSMIFNLQKKVEELSEHINGEAATVEHPQVSYTDFTEADDCTPHEDTPHCSFTHDAQPHSGQAVINTPSISLVENEKSAIRKVLEQCNGHRKAAAAQLGISERTLYRKIKEYGLEP